MNIYIIRHGETNYNVERRFQGMWGDSRLTENGKAQVLAAKKLIENISFDHIYSCDCSIDTENCQTQRLL